jgi:UDP-2,4-diacetamido-2,4,6-trideoxy-beta-L-altropyranose hydrolase
MNIFILTEGGGKAGMGHISRCLSLSQAFHSLGFSATMIVSGEGLTQKVFADTNYILLDWIHKEAEVLSMIHHSDLLIIDSYICPPDLYQKLATGSLTTAYIDDDIRLDYPEGVVINGVMCAEKFSYPAKTNTTYLLGHQYSFLRKAFWEVPGKLINKEVRSVMITCGGNDENGLSYRILKSILAQYPTLHISVILKNRETRHLSFYEEHATVLTDLSALEMRQVMIDADIVITASGQTTYELCRTGTPFIPIITADNQQFSIDCFYEKGLTVKAINAGDPQLENKILKEFGTLSDYETRKKIHDTMKRTIDGQGSLRVVEHLLKTINKNNP